MLILMLMLLRISLNPIMFSIVLSLKHIYIFFFFSRNTNFQPNTFPKEYVFFTKWILALVLRGLLFPGD